MSVNEMSKLSVDTISWQDYRASNTSMVINYSSDPISEVPIREVPEELPSEIMPEPNYETKTYGFYGCEKSKIRNAFVKAKIRFLLFVTKYAGTKADFKDKYFITGYYRVAKTTDAKRLHIRYGSEYSCIDEDSCSAFRAEEIRFVSIEDAFPLTDAVLKSWDYKARITKQTRIVLNEDQTKVVVDFLKSKDDKTDLYIAETKRLEPHPEVSDDAEEEA